MTAAAPRLVIAGGGLAGCLAALAIAQRRPDVELLLLEQEQRFGGDHIWSFFDGDVDDEDKWLVEPIVARRWPDHEVRFPKRSRTLGFGYSSIRSEQLDQAVRARLRPDQYRLGASIASVSATNLLLEDGETIVADAIIDARGAANLDGLDLAWQKFVGRTYRFNAPHGSARPVIMDALVDQVDGYRFVYTLPFSETELLIEDTYYSGSPALDVPGIGGKIDAYASEKGWEQERVTSEETGVLPVALGGEIDSLWSEGPKVARLGLRGGFFHPTTGYSLPDAVRNATLLVEQKGLSSPTLHAFYRARAKSLWKERQFYRMLNRMLFRAAAPSERYRVLEHFYRLPDQVIARFYGGRSTALDKVRILSGKPPVPIGAALAAMREKAV
jgi:lycopene beta-cyclase